MKVTAVLVKELREHTGAGMMECKKVLEEANGDVEAAIIIMRKSGQAKAVKKSGRIAAEGIIIVKTSGDNKKAVMLEINCETDFVARDDSFLEFSNQVALQVLESDLTNLDQLLAMKLANGKTVVENREELVTKIGENVNIRRIVSFTSSGVVGSYVHSNQRIGVLVELSVDDFELGKDISMHIAAVKPLALLPEELPEDILSKEKEIFLAQMQDANKPKDILEKIISGKMKKFISESVLIKQSFVKDPDLSIEDLLKKSTAKITRFARFEVGEGIEKKETDFAAEVKAQVESSK